MKIIVFDSGITQPEDRGILLKDIIEDGEGCIKNHGKLSLKNDKSQCLDANYWKGCDDHGQRTMIITDGAFRGRNPENPSDRSSGTETVQRLEINNTGKANCITSVSKDSLCIQVGVADIKGNESIKRIYSEEGKSPCLTTMGGGNREPKIAVKDATYKNRDERIYTEKSPTLRCGRGGFEMSDNNITWRKLTPLECCRLQTVPDNYFKDENGNNIISNSQQYKCLGNGWTVEVIAHIFSYMKKDMEKREKKSA